MTPGPSLKKCILAIALVGVFAVSNIPTNAIAETSSPTASPGVTISNVGSLSEGGPQLNFNIVLDSEPTDTVEIEFNNPDGQLEFPGGNGACFVPSGASITPGSPYEPCNEWNLSKSVIVGAVDDNSDEGDQTSIVNPSLQSNDLNYNAIVLSSLNIQVVDNDHIDPPIADLALKISLVTQGAISANQNVDYSFKLINNGPGNYVLHTQDSGGDDSGIYVVVPSSFDIPAEKGTTFDTTNENMLCSYAADASDFGDEFWDNYGNSRVLICSVKNDDISIDVGDSFSFDLILKTNQILPNNSELLGVFVVNSSIDPDMPEINNEAQLGNDVFHSTSINNISQAIYQIPSNVSESSLASQKSPSKIAARSVQLPTTGTSSVIYLFKIAIVLTILGAFTSAVSAKNRKASLLKS